MLELIKPVNFITACDAYALGHWLEVPEHVQKQYVVVVPRKVSPYAKEIVAMGQTFVARVVAAVRITDEMIDEAEVEANEQGYEFNRAGWEIIAREMDGRLPLQVWGVEEGRVVKPQTPILGLVNTDKRFAWLPTYSEEWIQSVLWYMSTVASICRVCRITFEQYMVMTGSDLAMLDYKVHFFGDRAAPGREAAVMAGISHAALFSGSDCAQANGYIKAMYRTTKPYTSSVEASQHSTMCLHSNAETKDDYGAAEMIVTRLEARAKSKIGIPLMSGVIDTYDDERFVDQYLGKKLKSRIVNSGGKLVARPDSGNPALKSVQVLGWLENNFGVDLNSAGFKNTPPCVGMIYGDGMNVMTFEDVLKAVYKAHFCMDPVVEGMGHGLANYGARDDFSFSMKAVAYYDGTRWVRMLKEPKTDLGKKSLSGLVRCRENEQGELEVFDALAGGQEFLFTQDAPGWRLYTDDGYQKYRRQFDDVRIAARAETAESRRIRERIRTELETEMAAAQVANPDEVAVA